MDRAWSMVTDTGLLVLGGEDTSPVQLTNCQRFPTPSAMGVVAERVRTVPLS